ncbi:Uncharacterised protein [Mycobacterium tuberculosis]|nr:Uncharacterised protein [Mycobacterium tuberculosis]
MLPTREAEAADVTKCSTTIPSSSTAIWVYRVPGSGGSVRTRSRTTITRSTASRRARNSASLNTGGRRRPASRPSRRRCRLASRRVEPSMPLISVEPEPPSCELPALSPARGTRSCTTVLGGSSGNGPSNAASLSSPEADLRRRRRRRRRLPASSEPFSSSPLSPASVSSESRSSPSSVSAASALVNCWARGSDCWSTGSPSDPPCSPRPRPRPRRPRRRRRFAGRSSCPSSSASESSAT